MGKIYVVTSGKGGTGKTTSTVNLGAALNKLSENVVIVDANLTTPNIGLYLGAPVAPVTLNHVLQGKAKIEDAIYQHESGTKVVPASLSSNELKEVNYDSLKDVARKLRTFHDHVIFDSAAGLGEEAKLAIETADEVIVIVNPNILSVTDALKAIKFSQNLNKIIRGAIITRVNYDKTEMSASSIKEMLDVPILGVVPEDKAIRKSLHKKSPVINIKPKSKSSRAYQEIAGNLAGKEKESSLYRKLLAKLGIRS